MTLPNLGEGIESGTVVNISVQRGDVVSVGQVVLEVEADKVTVEIPAPKDGSVVDLFVSPGDQISVGTELLALRSSASSAKAPDVPFVGESAPSERHGSDSVSMHPNTEQGSDFIRQQQAPAGPAARRMARKLGLDISSVVGSGRHGRINRQDVIAHGAGLIGRGIGSHRHAIVSTPLPDLSKFGQVDQLPLTSIQAATAGNMARAWREIPHAWLQRQIDITDLELYRQRTGTGESGVSLTLFLIKALAHALVAFPKFNASIDTANGCLLQRQYVDIGVAVDTPRGLVVPVVRGVDQKGLQELDADLRHLKEDARANRLSVNALRGAGITLSNLGSMGVDAIFPLINWPQSAIVGIASAHSGVMHDHDSLRQLLPVTMAIDHRLINGAEGVRFLEHLADILQRPGDI